MVKHRTSVSQIFLQAESFASQHTGKRQREELSLALQPQLKGRLTPVEADELKLKSEIQNSPSFPPQLLS